tara:strand:- start:2463 stop:2642 length:180 start_codon:yes stop_codon:yes gene_type:complete
MDSKEIFDDLTDLSIKLEGAINMLVGGKQIASYQKLMGVKDKLYDMRNKINQQDEDKKA